MCVVSGFRLFVLNLVGVMLNLLMLNLLIIFCIVLCNFIGLDDLRCVISDMIDIGLILFLCRFCSDRVLRCFDSVLFCGLVSSEWWVKVGIVLLSVLII